MRLRSWFLCLFLFQDQLKQALGSHGFDGTVAHSCRNLARRIRPDVACRKNDVYPFCSRMFTGI